MQQLQYFQSTVSVFLTYLILKAAPITAVVYYFFDWQFALASAFVLLGVILCYSGFSNHHFSLDKAQLNIHPSLFFWQKTIRIPYKTILSIEIKYSSEKDGRQWLNITTNDSTSTQENKYRCDWLHMQDPPDEDEKGHGHPEHELFELLENEDFYEGSLEQLSHLLQQRGIKITSLI